MRGILYPQARSSRLAGSLPTGEAAANGSPTASLSVLAQQQYGLVSLRQAVDLGLLARTLQDRVQRQGWVRVHRGVYALPGSVRSYERDIAGALLAVGPAAVACRRTAACLAGQPCGS